MAGIHGGWSSLRLCQRERGTVTCSHLCRSGSRRRNPGAHMFLSCSPFDSSWVPTPLGDSAHIQYGCICHFSYTVIKHRDQGNLQTEEFMWLRVPDGKSARRLQGKNRSQALRSSKQARSRGAGWKELLTSLSSQSPSQ